MGMEFPLPGRWARAVALGFALGGAPAPPTSPAEEPPRRVAAIVSPDGRREAHAVPVIGPGGAATYRIAVANADGTGGRFLPIASDARVTPSWFGDDRLILDPGSKPSGFRILDLEGHEVENRSIPGRCDLDYAALSPDGRLLAYSGTLDRKVTGHRIDERGQFGLFVIELATGSVRKLTEQNVKTDPAWSPDSTMIAAGVGGYVKDYALTVYRAATGESEVLPVAGVGAAWSPDGGAIAFTGNVVQGGSWLRGIPLDGQVVVWDRNTRQSVAIGPPGRNVQDQPPGRWELSGSHAPTWSRDGRRLAFRRSEQKSGAGLNQKAVAIWAADRDGANAHQILDRDVDRMDWLADNATLAWVRAGHFGRVDVDRPGATGSTPAAPEGRFSVAGTVRDPDGKPIPGVLVRVATGWGTLKPSDPIETDAEGRYRIDFAPGMMSSDPAQLQVAVVTAAKTGYIDRDQGRSGQLGMAYQLPRDNSNRSFAGIVYPDHPYTLNFTLAPAARVRILLTDPEGKPLVNYRILLDGTFGPGNGVASAESDGRGMALLEPVPLIATRFVLKADSVEVASDPWPDRGPGDRKVHLTYDALDATLRWENDPAPEK